VGRETKSPVGLHENCAAYWVERLGLVPHPEGGYYREIYRSSLKLPAHALGGPYTGPRCTATAIYFLLPGKQVSSLHRLASDEIWCFFCGSSLTLHIIDSQGEYERRRLGACIDQGQSFQVVVPRGVWFGATVDDPTRYSLVGCIVAPGFDFSDFELGRRGELLMTYPQHAEIITRLTRP